MRALGCWSQPGALVVVSAVRGILRGMFTLGVILLIVGVVLLVLGLVGPGARPPLVNVGWALVAIGVLLVVLSVLITGGVCDDARVLLQHA